MRYRENSVPVSTGCRVGEHKDWWFQIPEF